MILLIAALTLSLAACATDAPEQTVGLGQVATLDEVRVAVKMALAGRHWLIANEQPGSIQAVMPRPDMGGETAVILIKYTADTVIITPLGVRHAGEDINTAPSKPKAVVGGYIGFWYINDWVRNLQKDIPMQLQWEKIRTETRPVEGQ